MTKTLSKYRNSLMGFAAILILLYHTYARFLMGIWFIGEAEYIVSRILFYGVDIFLLLSGLGITYSLKHNTIGRYYINRAKRIFPPIIIATTVMALIDKWPLPIFISRVSGKFIFENMYSYLWFYPAIVIFYLVAPLFYEIIIQVKNKLKFATIFFVAYVAMALIIYHTIGEVIVPLYGVFNRIPIFVFGICLGCSDDTEPLLFTRKNVIVSVVLLFVGGFLAWYTSIKEKWLLVPNSNCFLPNICLAIASCLIVCVILEALEGKKIKENAIKFLNFFGGISFELYIVQEWICKKLREVYEPVGRHKSVIFDVMCWSIVIVVALLLKYATMMFSKVKPKIINDVKQ